MRISTLAAGLALSMRRSNRLHVAEAARRKAAARAPRGAAGDARFSRGARDATRPARRHAMKTLWLSLGAAAAVVASIYGCAAGEDNSDVQTSSATTLPNCTQRPSPGEAAQPSEPPN